MQDTGSHHHSAAMDAGQAGSSCRGAGTKRAVSDHGPAAYTVSVLSAQELKLQMLGRSAEECPPNISREMLDRLNEKTGREDTVVSLEGAPRERSVSRST